MLIGNARWRKRSPRPASRLNETWVDPQSIRAIRCRARSTVRSSATGGDAGANVPQALKVLTQLTRQCELSRAISIVVVLLPTCIHMVSRLSPMDK